MLDRVVTPLYCAIEPPARDDADDWPCRGTSRRPGRRARRIRLGIEPRPLVHERDIRVGADTVEDDCVSQMLQCAVCEAGRCNPGVGDEHGTWMPSSPVTSESREIAPRLCTSLVGISTVRMTSTSTGTWAPLGVAKTTQRAPSPALGPLEVVEREHMEAGHVRCGPSRLCVEPKASGRGRSRARARRPCRRHGRSASAASRRRRSAHTRAGASPWDWPGRPT